MKTININDTGVNFDKLQATIITTQETSRVVTLDSLQFQLKEIQNRKAIFQKQEDDLLAEIAEIQTELNKLPPRTIEATLSVETIKN